MQKIIHNQVREIKKEFKHRGIDEDDIMFCKYFKLYLNKNLQIILLNIFHDICTFYIIKLKFLYK